jgi:hypothetical protein
MPRDGGKGNFPPPEKTHEPKVGSACWIAISGWTAARESSNHRTSATLPSAPATSILASSTAIAILNKRHLAKLRRAFAPRPAAVVVPASGRFHFQRDRGSWRGPVRRVGRVGSRFVSRNADDPERLGGAPGGVSSVGSTSRCFRWGRRSRCGRMDYYHRSNCWRRGRSSGARR